MSSPRLIQAIKQDHRAVSLGLLQLDFACSLIPDFIPS